MLPGTWKARDPIRTAECGTELFFGWVETFLNHQIQSITAWVARVFSNPHNRLQLASDHATMHE